MKLMTQNLPFLLNSFDAAIEKIFTLLRDPNVNDPNIFHNGLLVVARITGRRFELRPGIYELLERFFGTSQNEDVVKAALTLLTNRIYAEPPYRLTTSNCPNLWKKLVEEFLPQSANKGNYSIRKRIIDIWEKFEGCEMVKLFGERKTEVYKLFCIFKNTDKWMLGFISELAKNDDKFIEVSMENGILDLLESGINGKNNARNEVVKVVINIICSRSIYLSKVMEHKIWKIMITHATKKQISNFGALLAAGIIKSFGKVATLEQIYEFLQNDDIISKCFISIRLSFHRNILDSKDVDMIIDKLQKLSKITKNEMKSEITKCVSEVENFLRLPEEGVLHRPRPRGYWVLAI